MAVALTKKCAARYHFHSTLAKSLPFPSAAETVSDTSIVRLRSSQSCTGQPFNQYILFASCSTNTYLT
jgi:hypothetical protein